MKRRLIIARWDEDVSWATAYPHLIYDKGGAALEADGLNVIRLNENPEGHEFHTYLYHIITNFDNLDDYSVFVQGHPFDHAKDWAFQWSVEADFAWIGHWFVMDGDDGKPHHHNIIPVGRAFERIFGRPSPGRFPFVAASQAVISKRKILSRKKDFYIKVQQLGFEAEFERDWGYTLERLWWSIFNESL